MVSLVDPIRQLIEQGSEKTAAEIVGATRRRGVVVDPASLESRMHEDFRVFLIMGWRHLLGVDPAPIMLDFAYNLQHGADRQVLMAFRGFSKSWITGFYALWLLFNDPQEKVLVESGALDRAVATTNWCLMLILSWPPLAHLKPRSNQRQSSKAFDVGPAKPEQSPSFHAMGIGGQAVGFRASIIIPDDVETNTNSITSTMRGKIRDAVKEFDSVLKPGGRIKFLGTPHDEESLYNELPKRGYTALKYPAKYPTAEQVKRYGDTLAPFILAQMRKLGPGCVGQSTMPSRFPMDDLAKRELSLGKSEFALQFMLDTSMADKLKYPLKAADLMVMALDPMRGPEVVSWSAGPQQRVVDLQPMGFEGDFYYAPVVASDGRYAKYNRIVAAIDNSGRGADETSISIVGEVNGVLYLLAQWATKAGFEPATLVTLASMCVQYRANEVRIEANFGDGMFAALFRPVLEKAWKLVNNRNKAKGTEDEGGTMIVEVRSSNLLAKEKRILAVLEPVTQQHRLVVARSVIEWDLESIQRMDGEDGRHRYSLMHQFTHLTRERESLDHDDRIDSLAMAIGGFADILGVDPHQEALRRGQEASDEEWEKLFGDNGETDEGVMGLPRDGAGRRPKAVGIQSR